MHALLGKQVQTQYQTLLTPYVLHLSKMKLKLRVYLSFRTLLLTTLHRVRTGHGDEVRGSVGPKRQDSVG